MEMLHDPRFREECGEPIEPMPVLGELLPDAPFRYDTEGAERRTIVPANESLAEDPGPIRGCLMALPISLVVWGLLLLLVF